MLTAMTSREIVLLALVFVAWTMTSFICHESGKTFLALSGTFLADVNVLGGAASNIVLAVVLTASQCLVCYGTVNLKSLTSSPLRVVLVTSHVLATLATNYSMTYIEAASTQAIKLTEPVTMAIGQHLYFKTPATAHTLISLPVIISGALLFSGKSLADATEICGIFLAFSSNIILTARNIGLKSGQTAAAKSQLTLRSAWCISLLLLCLSAVMLVVMVLDGQHSLPAPTLRIVGCLFASSVFHVVYSYISTNVVLKVMNVVSHSIANIFKRLLVVLLLYAVGKRQASGWNLLGLAVATVGLYIYVRGKHTASSDTQSHADVKGDGTQSWFSSAKYQRSFGLLLSCLALLSFTSVINSTNNILFHPNSYLTSNFTIYNRDLTFLKQFMNNPSYTPKSENMEFLSWSLVDHPFETDLRAKELTTNLEIVAEAQRILFNLLSDLIGPARHVMLMEIATYQNKGDPAITAGEVMLLRKLNKTIVYYCETWKCDKPQHLEQAVNIGKNYSADDLVILMQGGGNLVGYDFVDRIRKNIMDAFPKHRQILLSQSIWLNGRNNKSLELCKEIYSNRSNLVMFLRDRQSLEIARANFHGVKHILAPDMAFGMGMVPRQMPPFYDVIWLKRGDGESSKYELPEFPAGISVHVSDWIKEWVSNVGTRDMETSLLIATAGFQFLQRGRVVITDRLHGHILSTMMSIPHVLIDNPPFFKLSSFDRSWTRSLSNAVKVSNGTLALEAAIGLLRQYNASLPQVGPRDMNRFQMVKV